MTKRPLDIDHQLQRCDGNSDAEVAKAARAVALMAGRLRAQGDSTALADAYDVLEHLGLVPTRPSLLVGAAPVSEPNLCGNGLHLKTPENLVRHSDGKDRCKPCQLASNREKNRRRRAAAKERAA